MTARRALVLAIVPCTLLPLSSSRAEQASSTPFTDITLEAGIRFVHTNGARGEKLLPETMGGGVAFFDYDEDGDQDLFFVNSAPWDPAAPPTPSALYRNEGEGRFAEVTKSAGLGEPIYGQGVAAGDADGDGWTDLFLTAVGPNRLLRNEDGVFRDVTTAAGVGGGDAAWSTCAAFFDADGDGDLDLFVCNYLEWSVEIDRDLDYRTEETGSAYAPPTLLRGAHPFFYRNRGNGSFEERASATGFHVEDPLTGEPVAKALGSLPADLDGDDLVDLLVVNDTTRNLYFHNRGDGSFEETGELTGLAYDSHGRATGAMGLDVAMLDGDRTVSVAVGNFADEATSLYRGDVEHGFFADESLAAGLGAGTRPSLTFGLLLFDADLDGAVDLFQANGHVEPDIAALDPGQSYRQPPQLFRNDGRGRFGLLAEDRVGDLSRPLAGRGAAYADVDGDGDQDLIVTQVGDRAVLLRNDQASGHHWLRVRLSDPSRATALGARVELAAGDSRQIRWIQPTRSYLSQVELVATFGLGPEAPQEADLLVIWPDGHRRHLRDVKVDRVSIVVR